ncbi:ATP-binding protein [Neobacillus sp. Marseille-QA0830]
MPKGGQLTIEIGKRNNHQIIIRIMDEGMGMPKEILDKLGLPFYTRKEKGTGLGFIISKNLVN